ncbi:8424_t:CDS:2 [Ambispora gerdemannii]|uniref:8424_t:CDS:1 n=1 Tax=Ambispora gerdemannii TaxID=144530 RepID=A0A9N8WI17_9GLOM|nr:8424_t:CDS:2 [Ambispora gerdemannii]
MVGIVKYLCASCGYRDRNRFSTQNRFSCTKYDDDGDVITVEILRGKYDIEAIEVLSSDQYHYQSY